MLEMCSSLCLAVYWCVCVPLRACACSWDSCVLKVWWSSWDRCVVSSSGWGGWWRRGLLWVWMSISGMDQKKAWPLWVGGDGKWLRSYFFVKTNRTRSIIQVAEISFHGRTAGRVKSWVTQEELGSWRWAGRGGRVHSSLGLSAEAVALATRIMWQKKKKKELSIRL